MRTLQRTLALAKASRKVIAINTTLLVYPLLSLLAIVGLFVLFLIPTPFGLALLSSHSSAQNHWLLVGHGFVILFLIIATQWLTAFVNTAFYLSADAALQGVRIGIRSAFANAWTYRLLIAKWAVFAGVIGYLISLLDQYFKFIGSISARLFGLAWSLATVFVIPVLVRHNLTHIDTLKYSSNLFKKTWGEQVSFDFSAGVIIFILCWIYTGIFIALYALALNGNISPAIGLGFGLAAVSPAIFAGIYFSTIYSIFNAALFRFAETGDYIGPYSPEFIESAYTFKKSR